MKKKIIAALAASAILLTAGCSGAEKSVTDEPLITDAGYPENKTTGTDDINDINDNNAADETDSSGDSVSDTETDVLPRDRSASGYSLTVSGKTGKMSISRAEKKSKPMGDPDIWTIFVYLCGTDLESAGKGNASSDFEQMIEATEKSKVRFVVQTGGTRKWKNEMFSAKKAERYIISDGNAELAYSGELTSMGSSDTLADFLEWGVANCASGKMGVVFWDHGGGSISGVCFDELNDDESLLLSDINSAFSQVYENMTDRFEFSGFDCCLMGTVENANILASYAKYFYGSQEVEPGSGWNYTAIGDFLAKKPAANGAELGKAITDGYCEECNSIGRGHDCTFTVVDLEKFDNFIIAFNDYSKQLYEASEGELAEIVRGVKKADNFGGNNKSEGYTNMVDVGGIVNNCSAYADGSKVLKALKNCIVYNISGSGHKNASGLSVYYPLQLQDTMELRIFSGICISPYYLSLVDMIAKGYSDNGYTNEVFFTED